MAEITPTRSETVHALHTLYKMNPDEIIITESNGRYERASLERVKHLAESIYSEGQFHAVLGQPAQDERVRLIAGHTRVRAIQLIRCGFESSFGSLIRDPNFTVKVDVFDCTEQEATIKGVVENSARVDLTPMDKSHLCAMLTQEPHNLQGKEAARYLGIDAATVTNLLKLQKLSDDAKSKVHSGEWNTAYALEVLRIKKEGKRSSVTAYAEQIASGNKPTVRDLKRAVRSVANQDSLCAIETPRATNITSDMVAGNQEHNRSAATARGRPAEVPDAAIYTRNWSRRQKSVIEIKEFLYGLSEYDPRLNNLGMILVSWITGETQDKSCCEKLSKLVASSTNGTLNATARGANLTMTNTESEFLTVAEVAAQLSVSQSRIRTILNNKKARETLLPGAIRGTAQWHIPISALGFYHKRPCGKPRLNPTCTCNRSHEPDPSKHSSSMHCHLYERWYYDNIRKNKNST